MAYTPFTWKDKESDANAERFNHIETGLGSATSVAEAGKSKAEEAKTKAEEGVSKSETALSEVKTLGEKTGLPVIAPIPGQTSQIGTSVEYKVVATNTTSFSATGLPPGLMIATSTGRIAGTPSETGTFKPAITATNTLGTDLEEFIWTISAASAPTISKPANQTGNVGSPVGLQIEATNTTEYKILSASLPAGLSINAASGKITGTPTTAATYKPKIEVINGSGGTATTEFEWVISAALVLPAFRKGSDEGEVKLSSGAGVTTLKAPEPPIGTQVGDMLVMCVQSETGEATFTTPETWARVGTNGTVGVRNFYIFLKVHNGTAMPTLTASGATTIDIRMFAVQGAEGLDVQSGWNNQTTATPAIANVTTTSANDLDIVATAKLNGAFSTLAAPSTYTSFNSKNQFRIFYKNQAGAGESGASTTTNTNEAITVITFALKKTGTVAGITEKLSEDSKAVEPVSIPAGTKFINVARCTAKVGQDENTRYEQVASTVTRMEGTTERPWVALQALNEKFEPIGAYTERLETKPELKIPVITKPAAQTGHIGTVVSFQLAATESPTSWSWSGNPAGLSLSNAGLVTGTPTTLATYKPKVTATNAKGVSAEVEFEWVIGAAVTTSLQTGLVLNSDSTSSATMIVVGYKPSVVRDGEGIGTAASTIKSLAEFFNSHGTLLQPLAGFSGRIPSSSEAKGLKAWAEAIAPLGGKYIEFGNETSYTYQVGPSGGEPYGERAKEALEAMAGTGVKLLIQGDDANTGSKEWVNGIFTAFPGIVSHSAFGGWTIHSYPSSKVESDPDTVGVPKMERLVKTLEEHGDTTSKIFNTEWGAPCTNSGLTMTISGQSLNWSEGAKLLEKHIPLLEGASKKRLVQLLLYQAHDQKPDTGKDTEREHFFGAVQSNGAAKGAFTTFVKSFI